jgi:hypothetical protein
LLKACVNCADTKVIESIQLKTFFKNNTMVSVAIENLRWAERVSHSWGGPLLARGNQEREIGRRGYLHVVGEGVLWSDGARIARI